MGSPHKLIRYIRKAKSRLALEHYIRMLQAALFYGFASAAAILLVSRLFVFPYYIRLAMIVGSIVFIAVFLYAFWKRPSSEEATRKLDAFFPDNLLLTAVSFLHDKSPLIKQLLEKTEQSSEKAFVQFKQREKRYVQPRWIIGFVIAFAAVLVLYAFPAATQLEAKDIEKEDQIVKEMKKEVEKLEKKELAAICKKRIEGIKREA